LIKRAVDVVIATALAVVAAPVVAVLALAIRLTSPGPVFHRAIRVGRDGVPFRLLKLRSMRTDGPGGAALTAGGDDRVTPLGRVIRRAKLDELPQLWNVISGDMSLVGPRPEDPRYVEWYTPEQRRLLAWRPGITSPASVTFRDEEQVLATLMAAGRPLEDAYREVLATKLSIELDYFPHATVVGDLRWMARTVAALLR
jgi:lipopolysaccharide/colanic/teichoic acid biosynthesis glycosyltransferase